MDRTVDALVLAHLDIADSIARKYSGRSGDWSDLRQVGYLGLVKAAQRFDPERGDDFVSYAVPTISGEIKRHLRDNGWFIRPPRAVQDTRTAIMRVTSQLTQRLGRAPGREELSLELGVPLELVDEALSCHESLRPSSIDASVGGDDSLSLADTLSAPDDDFERAELLAQISPATRALSARDRRILYLRFYEEWSQQKIGEELGVTQMQVSRLIQRILATLRESIGVTTDEVAEAATARPAAAATRRPAPRSHAA
ncbi:sigma-70 family RNA polymerase sigma factor [Desertivibrio insolitus]|uniref:sigma-70 family RNA polymerase sigma factor n=1 Tax=Herbiconiux sp. SYSU D00978 TaxID=2812562 RepID=UPI001A971C5C|nr:sigma-70 family RNA polymerase sigma factor [Herbiconiux sp. SYSU D00978]